MAGITFGGASSTSSGSSIGGPLDVQYIVEQIIASKKKPITDLETFQVFYTEKKKAFQELNTKVSSLETALFALTGSGFDSKSASSSLSDYVGASSSSTATAGDYTVTVRQMARAQSTTSKGYSSAGEMVLTDGTTFTITQGTKTANISIAGQTRTLSGLKDAVNSSGLDVTAAVVYDGSAYKLQITSKKTGTANGFTIGDGAVGTAFNTNALSSTFSSASSAVLTQGKTLSITEGGDTFDFTIDAASDSLNELADTINNTVGLDVTASVKTSGSRSYLQLTSDTAGQEFSISDTGTGAGLQFARMAARDALVNINTTDEADAISRSSNTVSDVISGVTLTLKKEDASTPVTVTVSNDTAKVKENIQTFVTKFNELADFLNTQFTYNEEKNRAGVLSGEAAARKVQMDMLNLVSSRVKGIDESDPYKTMAVIGVSLNKEGKLEIDSAKLDDALANHLDSVKRIFKTVGTADSSDVALLSKSSSTKAGRYNVNITAVAEQAKVTSAAMGAETGETLTITYESRAYAVTLTNGMSHDDIVNAINTTMSNSGVPVTASKSTVGADDFLVIATTQYGSAQQVQVSSSVNGNGSGFSTTAASDTGVDVAGTIGGNAASGSGQILTSQAGDSSGMMVFVNATTPGDKGEVYLTFGAGETLRQQLSEISFPFTGLLAKNIESLDDQLLSISQKITDINYQLQKEQELLISQFSKANEALVQLQYLQSSLSGKS